MKEAIRKVIILGSGALKIGEAGEFDYSGSQALKALKEEGVDTVLINPNIATVQTSEELAGKIYFLPVTPYFVEKIIEKEQPDGILLSFGGQTALNCGIELFGAGVFDRFNIKVLGTPVRAIMDTEDRELFIKRLDEIDVKTPRSIAVTGVDEAVEAAARLGFPVIIRAAFTLGGQGSGFASDAVELRALSSRAFSHTCQILVEESLKGWKEVEYEVVRDRYDNCITVCNMENFDPLGIHTGESIVVAPCQTLSAGDLNKLRELSVKIIRHIGIVGECNIQYALSPDSSDYRVIEVNARLSRSSALASKATGYPLAFIAAKLGLGYGLHELKNPAVPSSTAYFEPAPDYIICKIPRWDLNKFAGVSHHIGSSMKSVGEVMAIGKTFEEVIQKGLRMIGQGMHGFTGNRIVESDDIEKELAEPTDMRIFVIAEALDKGLSVDRIHELTRIDKWFLYKLRNIISIKNELCLLDSLESVPPGLLAHAKINGFSDFQIARHVLKSDPGNIHPDLLKVREKRKSSGIIPYVRKIDTLVTGNHASGSYLYLTYGAGEHDPALNGNDPGRSVIVLGSGAYRIGSSVEFDWCSVNAISTIKKQGYRSVMINYNPETVSTDYDICDRLYFDELTFERVLDIIDLENPSGVIVSVGGQIPNNLAMRLYESNVPVLGTSPVSIDRAENRHIFSQMCDSLAVDQPKWKELSSTGDIFEFADRIGFPVLVRPSYVLSGAAMHVVSNRNELTHFLGLAAQVSKQHPVVVTEFIENAKEIEMDAVARDGEIIAYAISEHVEFAGVHSGDATIVFPAQKLYLETIRRIKRISRQIANELNISGPFNIQFLAKDNDIKVIECNLRASRSMPFVSKVLRTNLIELSTKIMLGLPVDKPHKSVFELDYVGVKAPQFSFSRLAKADPVLGVDMASTGEVGCIGEGFYEAILKAMFSVGYKIPQKSILLSTGPARSKVELLNSARALTQKGHRLYATRGTREFLVNSGVEAHVAYWPDEDKSPNAIELIRSREVDLVVNIPKNLSPSELNNDYLIRRSAVDFNVPLLTNARLASAYILAFCRMDIKELAIKSWAEYK